jgi:hypothetical protein
LADTEVGVVGSSAAASLVHSEIAGNRAAVGSLAGQIRGLFIARGGILLTICLIANLLRL